MVQTWQQGKGDDFICECGALYEVTIRRLPFRENDSASCSVCGNVMQTWNSTEALSFSLKKQPDNAGD
jgi:hypothetical protein